MFKKPTPPSPQVIYALDRKTDTSLGLLCIRMALTNLLWLINLLFVYLSYMNARSPAGSPRSFKDLVLLAFVFLFGLIGLYSLKMLSKNFICLYNYLFKTQHDVVIYSRDEKLKYYRDTLLADVKANKKYTLISAISLLPFFISIFYALNGLWIDAMFSCLCYAVMISDRLMLAEFYEYQALVEYGNQLYGHQQPTN